jgi:fructose-bisphosphate aldolase, class II
MKLKEILSNLKNNQALLHYNVSTFEQIKAGIEAVKETKIPLIFGVSEGEREYLGEGLVRKILDFYEQDENLKDLIFLNADHCKSLKSAINAINLNYDAVLFDGSDFNTEDNIKITKEIVIYKKDKDILIEGEVGKNRRKIRNSK